MAAGRYDLRAALGLAYGGIPAVLVAGLLVKSMPIGVLRWMVVCVVIYAAFVMLRSSGGDRRVRRDANARQRTAT
jgi:uncharacterized membrane protein YfcA